MNAQLNSFTFGVNSIRVVQGEDGQPWFIAADVCAVLELGNPTQALTRLDDDEQSTLISNEGGPGRRIVSESGLYELVLGSRKTEAKAFKRWIKRDVLPSIRKTGKYFVDQFATLVPKTFPEALRALATTIEERETLALQVQSQMPAVEFRDAVADSKDGQSIGEVAKVIGTGQNRLFAWLRSKRILMANNLPYQEHQDAGRFRVIYQAPWKDSSGEEHIPSKTLITGKGLIWIQRLWNEDHDIRQAS